MCGMALSRQLNRRKCAYSLLAVSVPFKATNSHKKNRPPGSGLFDPLNNGGFHLKEIQRLRRARYRSHDASQTVFDLAGRAGGDAIPPVAPKSLRFLAILSLRYCNRLPLHIQRIVRTASA